MEHLVVFQRTSITNSIRKERYLNRVTLMDHTTMSRALRQELISFTSQVSVLKVRRYLQQYGYVSLVTMAWLLLTFYKRQERFNIAYVDSTDRTFFDTKRFRLLPLQHVLHISHL